MRHPQLLVYERDGLLANLFRRAELNSEWSLREPRKLDSCLRLLRRGGPAVLVIAAGRDLEREMTLLERVSWLYPETATIVVGDTEDPALTGLAWDLGAVHVLLPPLQRDQLLDVVRGCMAARIRLATTSRGALEDA